MIFLCMCSSHHCRSRRGKYTLLQGCDSDLFCYGEVSITAAANVTLLLGINATASSPSSPNTVLCPRYVGSRVDEAMIAECNFAASAGNLVIRCVECTDGTHLSLYDYTGAVMAKCPGVSCSEMADIVPAGGAAEIPVGGELSRLFCMWRTGFHRWSQCFPLCCCCGKRLHHMGRTRMVVFFAGVGEKSLRFFTICSFYVKF